MKKQNNFGSLEELRRQISHVQMKKMIDDEFKALEENTYTEEQVREAIDLARGYQIDYDGRHFDYTEDEIIQLLKQPK